jgi:hypothetical protein
MIPMVAIKMAAGMEADGASPKAAIPDMDIYIYICIGVVSP